MIQLICTVVIAFIAFFGGIYFEKANSIRKVKPLKTSLTSINRGRTIVVDRTKE